MTGPSQCGKSTVRNFITAQEDEQFHPVILKKYSTRIPRETEDDTICVKSIPPECDLVYEQYGVRYGFHFDDLYDAMEKGQSPIIVLNDIRAVEDVRTALSPQVISIFMYRRPPDFEYFLNEEKRRAKEDISEEAIRLSAQLRFDKAKSIFRIYTENISLFDFVVLNTSELQYTEQQIDHIVAKIKAAGRKLKV